MIKSATELKLTQTYNISRINNNQQKRNYGKWMFNGWDENNLSFVDSFEDDGVELLLPRGEGELFGDQWEIKLIKKRDNDRD